MRRAGGIAGRRQGPRALGSAGSRGSRRGMEFWKALDEVVPGTRHQRYWGPNIANVPNRFPKSVRPTVKGDLRVVGREPIASGHPRRHRHRRCHRKRHQKPPRLIRMRHPRSGISRHHDRAERFPTKPRSTPGKPLFAHVRPSNRRKTKETGLTSTCPEPFFLRQRKVADSVVC